MFYPFKQTSRHIPDEKRNIWKFPSVLENENKIENNYEKSSPPSSDYAENTPTNEFKKKLCSFGFAEEAILELISISFPERNFKTVPPKYDFDLVSTNSLLSVRKQICLPCFSTTEQITDCTTERC